MVETLREKQIKEAEELLFTGPQHLGVAKGLFHGRFVADWVMPAFSVNSEADSVVDTATMRIGSAGSVISLYLWRSRPRLHRWEGALS